MKREVFISYNSTSFPLVEKLAELLEQHDIYCWYAPRNLNKDGLGLEFDDEIVRAIAEVKAVVVLLTDFALESKWVKREVAQAEKQGKKIVPVVLDELTINNGLAMRLEQMHMLKVYPEPEKSFSLLMDSLQHLLGKKEVSTIGSNSRLNDTKPEGTIDSAGRNDKPDIYDLDYEEGIGYLEAGEYRDAFDAFLLSAEHHNPKAYDRLFAIMSINSRIPDFLDDDTWEHIEELSDQGEGWADLLMHYRYYGMGTQNETALIYLKRALSKQVSPYAFLQMGICYAWGLGVKISGIQQQRYYRIAYEGGCLEATRYLAQLYRFGNDKISIDLEKAEKYAREGAQHGVIGCYRQLFYILKNSHREEEARLVAQEMINNGYKEGYTTMGDYVYDCRNDREEAKKWYIRGAEHDDKDAWANLAFVALAEGDYDEAFNFAQKGVHTHNAQSLSALGFIYESVEKYKDLAKAWQYYMERVHLYGNCSGMAANLYIYKNYEPTEEQKADLMHYLRLEMQCGSTRSATALLQIILKDHGLGIDLNYESLREFPEALEYLRYGAEVSDNTANNGELQYLYGRWLIDDTGIYHDPFKGQRMLHLSALQGYVPALDYALENEKEEEKLREVCAVIIRRQIIRSKKTDQITCYGKDSVSPEELDSYMMRCKAWEAGEIYDPLAS